jgi:hypothetical protein
LIFLSADPLVSGARCVRRRQILPKYLGEKFHRLYGICWREEEERFRSEISERDYEGYLRAV